MIELTVTTQTGRLDKVLAQNLTDFSRSQIQQLIQEGHVLVNGKIPKTKYAVQPDDQIQITPPEPKTLDLIAQPIKLDIIYEDDDVLVVNKPQGMVVHPSAGHLQDTLVNALLYHCPLSTINGTFRPGIVHRIDKDTSGLLMVAKNDQAHQALAQQLKEKTNIRQYLALVHGNIKEDQGTIDAPIGRSLKDRKKQAVVANGKPAVTHFEVLQRFGSYTLISCKLETGRTHQIRVHLQYIGHPLAGDPVYGPKKTLPAKGQFLHAAKLGFIHPKTGELLVFEAPLPEYFTKTLTQLTKQQL